MTASSTIAPRAERRTTRPDYGVKLTFMPFIMRAAIDAIRTGRG